MGMTEFHPEGEQNPLLGELVEAEGERPLTDLPVLDPENHREPLSDDERQRVAAEIQASRQAPTGPSNGASGAAGAVGGPGAPAPGPPPHTYELDPRGMGAYAQPPQPEQLRAEQEAEISAAHQVAALEHDLKRSRRALQLLALAVIVAAASVALIAMRNYQAKLATDATSRPWDPGGDE